MAASTIKIFGYQILFFFFLIRPGRFMLSFNMPPQKALYRNRRKHLRIIDLLCSEGIKKFKVDPNVAKAGGLQSQGAKGAAVVNLLQALGNAGSGVLRLSP
jgi:hypothetical protein